MKKGTTVALILSASVVAADLIYYLHQPVRGKYHYELDRNVTITFKSGTYVIEGKGEYYNYVIEALKSSGVFVPKMVCKGSNMYYFSHKDNKVVSILDKNHISLSDSLYFGTEFKFLR